MSKTNIIAAAAFGLVAAISAHHLLDSTPAEQPSHARTQDTGYITGGYLEDFRNVTVAETPKAKHPKLEFAGNQNFIRPIGGCQSLCS